MSSEQPFTNTDYEPRVWPCRDCGVEVEVTGFAVGVAFECNRLCHVMEFEPLLKTELVRCQLCTVEHKAAEERRANKANELLRQLKFAARHNNAQQWMRDAPDWFTQDYEDQIASVLSRMGKLSTRTGEQMGIK